MKACPAPPLSACPDWLLSDQAPENPCFVLDRERLAHNLSILDFVQKKSGAKILLALKAFSSWPVFSMLSREQEGCLWGTCASSVDEARLGREKFGGEVHAFAAAWTEAEIRELAQTADHIVFNSLQQWESLKHLCLQANQTFRKNNPLIFGLRLNPELPLGAPAVYNPCSPTSRLGVRRKNISSARELEEFDGLHFHALCEQGAEDLQLILNAFQEKFEPFLKNRKWLNFGGGHHITREGYNLDLLISMLDAWKKQHKCQIYLEPGEAVALNAGWLSAKILDVTHADMSVAILDVSAACHMPDVMEMPYTPPLYIKAENGLVRRIPVASGTENPGQSGYRIRLAGKSCLAGDVIGEYMFPELPQAGSRIVFGDMAIYSMVKTTTFNGLRLPDIGLWGNGTFEFLRKSS